MICPNCKKELPDNSRFCNKCGYDFSKANEANNYNQSETEKEFEININKDNSRFKSKINNKKIPLFLFIIILITLCFFFSKSFSNNNNKNYYSINSDDYFYDIASCIQNIEENIKGSEKNISLGYICTVEDSNELLKISEWAQKDCTFIFIVYSTEESKDFDTCAYYKNENNETIYKLPLTSDSALSYLQEVFQKLDIDSDNTSEYKITKNDITFCNIDIEKILNKYNN